MVTLEMARLEPRFRIRAPLRCDGAGTLDWGEDSVTGERVAVRWLPLRANGEAAVQACAELPAHPALPKILQVGRLDERAYLVMAFPDGELLSSRLADGDLLELPGFLRVSTQLGAALALVHRHRLVHGELSVGSVLLPRDERVLWWDLPLVLVDRMTDRRSESRAAQQLTKTAASLAPECARGEPPSEAADVYSLGAVLCLAAGAPPPSAPSTLGVLHQVAVGQWTPRVPPVLPDAWAVVVRQMLDPVPGKRLTADEVVAAFAELAAASGPALEVAA